MERTEYRIYKATSEIMMKNARFNERHITPKSMQEIENCMFDDMEHLYDEIVGTFDTLEEAKADLTRRISSVTERRWSVSFYDVEMYFIEEVNVIVDEDGDVEEEELVGCWGIAEWEKDIFAESNEEE